VLTLELLCQPEREVSGSSVFGFALQDAVLRLPLDTHRGAVQYVLRGGMYFVAPGGAHVTGGAGFMVVSRQHSGIFLLGGPLEACGRLPYIDGCTDSLLLAPPMCGDPCLNHLHFPRGIVQTQHTHPSARVGAVVRGKGVCVHVDDRGNEHQTTLAPGMVFVIPAEAVHSFNTADSSMDVVAWHPDSGVSSVFCEWSAFACSVGKPDALSFCVSSRLRAAARQPPNGQQNYDRRSQRGQPAKNTHIERRAQPVDSRLICVNGLAWDIRSFTEHVLQRTRSRRFWLGSAKDAFPIVAPSGLSTCTPPTLSSGCSWGIFVLQWQCRPCSCPRSERSLVKESFAFKQIKIIDPPSQKYRLVRLHVHSNAASSSANSASDSPGINFLPAHYVLLVLIFR
jgi:hypothetical protein